MTLKQAIIAEAKFASIPFLVGLVLAAALYLASYLFLPQLLITPVWWVHWRVPFAILLSIYYIIYIGGRVRERTRERK